MREKLLLCFLTVCIAQDQNRSMQVATRSEPKRRPARARPAAFLLQDFVRLFQWIRSEGGTIIPGVVVKEIYGGWALAFDRPVAAGVPAIIVPPRLHMCENVPVTLWGGVHTTILASLNDFDRIVFKRMLGSLYFLHEMFQRERSYFWPYMRATPGLADLAYDIWHWDENEVRLAEELVDFGFGRGIRQEIGRLELLRRWHTHFCEILRENAGQPPASAEYLSYICNFRNLLWPLTLAKTRLFAFENDVCFLPLAGTNKQAHAHARTDSTRANRGAGALAHPRARTSLSHTHAHTRVTCTLTHSLTHSLARSHTRTQTPTQKHTPTHARRYTHTQTHTHKHKHKHKHGNAHTHTQTLTHARTHARMQIS